MHIQINTRSIFMMCTNQINVNTYRYFSSYSKVIRERDYFMFLYFDCFLYFTNLNYNNQSFIARLNDFQLH